MHPQRTTLLALHYQNDVVHPDGKIHVGLGKGSSRRATLLRSAELLLQCARRCSVPIVHVRVAYRSDSADIIQNGPIFEDVARSGAVIEGTWGSEFYQTLRPLRESRWEFVVKHTRINAFYGSQLQEILRATDTSRLLVAGVATHSVVESTVRHAVDAGYQVDVVKDACASAEVEVHEAALRSMSVIAHLVSVAELDTTLRYAEPSSEIVT